MNIEFEKCNIDFFPEIQNFNKRYDHLKERLKYFKSNEGTPGNRMIINGVEMINYSTYNYLGLNGDERINSFVKEAVDRYGTSVSGSRLLSGQVILHEQLEKKIADFLGTDDALTFVGGHSTNVNIVGNIVGRSDLILHDSLDHNSIIQGCVLSHAKRIHFNHNDMNDLENKIRKNRDSYRRVLIVVEGVYSMAGDICNLPELIRIKKEYGAILMIDEAHSFGTIGKDGRGVTSHFNISAKDVDILMGTLSKSAASCGGYIAGDSDFIRYLRYNSPGFVFSCGLTPANAAAALKAIELFEIDSFRLEKLKFNSEYFLDNIKKMGFDTGSSGNTPIIPLITGDSDKAIDLSNILYEKRINAMPIIYPAVNEKSSRIRFFLSAAHTKDDMDNTLDVLFEVCKK